MIAFDDITFSAGDAANAPAQAPAPANAAAPAAAPMTMNCQVTIDKAQVTYYDITGSTESELREAMDQLRPSTKRDFGFRWDVRWNWPGSGTDTCDLTAADVSYEIQIAMPCWKAPADASPELMAKWDQYIQSMALHLNGKVENFFSYYPGVKTAIQGATCSTAEAAGQNALDTIREAGAAYSLQTKEGETQGVKFP